MDKSHDQNQNPMPKKSKKNGYSVAESKNIINSYIDESSLRLQKKLTAEWKQQTQTAKKLSYA